MLPSNEEKQSPLKKTTTVKVTNVFQWLPLGPLGWFLKKRKC